MKTSMFKVGGRMITLQDDKWQIEIREELDYTFASVDNKHYDEVFRIEESDYSKTLSLRIIGTMQDKTYALIVPFYTPRDNFAYIFDNSSLFMMLNDILIIYDLKQNSVTKQVKIDVMGTMFQAYRYERDFILYGELEILRVNSDLSVLWSFSGRDIFVRYQSDQPAFIMKKDRICLYDFEENYYEIDYDGKLL